MKNYKEREKEFLKELTELTLKYKSVSQVVVAVVALP